MNTTEQIRERAKKLIPELAREINEDLTAVNRLWQRGLITHDEAVRFRRALLETANKSYAKFD